MSHIHGDHLEILTILPHPMNYHFPDSDPYGPGPEYTINTLEEFHVRAEFFEGFDGKLQSYTITLSQDGRDVGMRSDDISLSKISDDFENGMTFAMSIWTDYGHPWGNLDWLHHNVCDKHEPCGLPDLKLRNLAIRTKPSDFRLRDV